MTNSLNIIGTFMIGAATGSLVTWLKQRHLIAECRNLLERIPQNPQLSAEGGPRFGMKALVVSPDIEVIKLFSGLFREKGIETQNCFVAIDAANRLSYEKFEAIVLDSDRVEGCVDLLRTLPGPHKNVMAVVIASDSGKREDASKNGASFVIHRPLDVLEIRNLLRAAYGRMLRDLQGYFRLAVELPVSIRTVSGTVVQCRTMNLSRNGMALSTHESFTVGEKINVGFAVPNTSIFVSGEGEVIWDDKHGKTGVRFQCTNSTSQARFFEWLHDHFITELDTEPGAGHVPDQVVHAR
jgi:DNA-binding response OmpR family regulator